MRRVANSVKRSLQRDRDSQGAPLPEDSTVWETVTTGQGRALIDGGGIFPDLRIQEDTLLLPEQELVRATNESEFPLNLRVMEFGFRTASARIAADENLHMVFYRDMLSEAMLIDPSAAVHAIADEVIGFEMPGAGMENFTRKAAHMAKAGIYDLRIHHDEVVWPLLRHWGVFEAEGLDDAAERRREELRRFLVDLNAQASRFEARRALTLEREAGRAG